MGPSGPYAWILGSIDDQLTSIDLKYGEYLPRPWEVFHVHMILFYSDELKNHVFYPQRAAGVESRYGSFRDLDF